MTERTAPALEAQRLIKRYRPGRPAALDGVDLQIPAGSVVALVGPNGAGKSTLIRCFLGYERPNGGRSLVMGIDPQRDRATALGHIGYVGQTPGLYRDLTGNDHLEVAASLRAGFDREGAVDRLIAIGVDRAKKAGELSGGQQVQLALTIALGTRAPVLLLDEPLAALDPLARRDFLALVRAAAASGVTILFASHIVGDLGAVCNRLAVLASGRVMYEAPIADAVASHALVPHEDAAGTELVGVFDDRTGRSRALVRREGAYGNDDIELDDIVLGYLAAARASTAGGAAA